MAERGYPRHIPFPFDLRDTSIDIFKGEAASLLYDIFPGTLNVTEGNFRCHLLFQVEELPSGPLPLTVGGVPITILDEKERGRFHLFPRQILGQLSIDVCREGYDVTAGLLSGGDLRRLAVEFSREVEARGQDVEILEVIFTTARTFYVVLEDHIHIDTIRWKMPGRIAGCSVGYMNDWEIPRRPWPGSRTGRLADSQRAVEGVNVMRSVRIGSPGDRGVPRVVYDWLFPGQQQDSDDDSAQPADGSVAWHDAGVVRGSFDFYVEKGKFAGYYGFVSGSEDSDAGPAGVGRPDKK